MVICLNVGILICGFTHHRLGKYDPYSKMSYVFGNLKGFTDMLVGFVIVKIAVAVMVYEWPCKGQLLLFVM